MKAIDENHLAPAQQGEKDRSRNGVGVKEREQTKEAVPLIEFSGETPLGRSYNTRTTAIAAPGIVWMGEEMQIAVEALLPLNRRTGRGVGVIAQAHFFLDEMMPSVFGKPLLARD